MQNNITASSSYYFGVLFFITLKFCCENSREKVSSCEDEIRLFEWWYSDTQHLIENQFVLNIYPGKWFKKRFLSIRNWIYLAGQWNNAKEPINFSFSFFFKSTPKKDQFNINNNGNDFHWKSLPLYSMLSCQHCFTIHFHKTI